MRKEVDQLLAFFKTDPTVTPWFLRKTGQPPLLSASDREARRKALVLILRHSRDAGARREAGALLRGVLDEVLFDLEPDDRERFRGRKDVLEALEMANTVEWRSKRSERLASALRDAFRFNLEVLGEVRIEKLLPKIIDAANTLLNAERGVLFLRRSGRMVPVSARSRGRDLGDPAAHLSRTILDRAVAEGTSCLSMDAKEDTALRSIASVEALGLRSVLCVPLRLKRRIVGALYLDNPLQESVFEPADLELAEAFCAQAALAWRAAQDRRRLSDLLKELRGKNQALRGELELAHRDSKRSKRLVENRYHDLVGSSAAMRKLFDLIEALAPTDIPILVTGESGTGKELVARAIWRASRRSEHPFVAENCAALPAALLESALFGHVKGAFTGADRDRPGLFALADGGTLFLDEVAEMAPDLQTRLLRVLQDGEVRPLGSTRVLRVDVRVISATNHDAREAVAQGKLREDLYYRLQGAEVRVAPLRERLEDIPLLMDHFHQVHLARGGAPRRLRPETLDRLLRYAWPGNVRELESEARRLFVLSTGEWIGPELLSPQVREGVLLRREGERSSPVPTGRSLAEVERHAILETLRLLGGSRTKAAEALGISRSTLYLKLREMGYRDA